MPSAQLEEHSKKPRPACGCSTVGSAGLAHVPLAHSQPPLVTLNRLPLAAPSALACNNQTAAFAALPRAPQAEDPSGGDPGKRAHFSTRAFARAHNLGGGLQRVGGLGGGGGPEHVEARAPTFLRCPPHCRPRGRHMVQLTQVRALEATAPPQRPCPPPLLRQAARCSMVQLPAARHWTQRLHQDAGMHPNTHKEMHRPLPVSSFLPAPNEQVWNFPAIADSLCSGGK